MDDAVRILAAPRWNLRAAPGQLIRLLSARDLLFVLSHHRISVRYKQSLLGGLWALLQPLAMMLVFTAVFTRVTPVAASVGFPYTLFAYAGLLPWTFFSGTVSSGTASLVQHAHLVTKVYFPREILPLSYVLAGVVDLLIGSLALLVLAAYYRTEPTIHLLMVVPILIVLAAFALACALLLSMVQVRIRDVGMALPIALQLLMFMAPVVYPLDLVPASWRAVYLLNPLAGLIDSFRRSVLGLPFDYPALACAVLVTAAMLPAAYIAFKHAEVTMADII